MNRVVDKRVVFIIQPHSIVDIITNSSSELFTFEGESKDVVRSMIYDIYPNFRSEYHELISIDEMEDSEIEDLAYWLLPSYDITKEEIEKTLNGLIPFGEIYEEDTWWKERGRTIYRFKYDSLEKYIPQIKDIVDPERKMYFLYSIDENPDWEMQQELETIGTRHHLG